TALRGNEQMRRQVFAGQDCRQRWKMLKMPAAAVILTISPGIKGATARVHVAKIPRWRKGASQLAPRRKMGRVAPVAATRAARKRVVLGCIARTSQPAVAVASG